MHDTSRWGYTLPTIQVDGGMFRYSLIGLGMAHPDFGPKIPVTLDDGVPIPMDYQVFPIKMVICWYLLFSDKPE